jgi:hypothetical protein
VSAQAIQGSRGRVTSPMRQRRRTKAVLAGAVVEMAATLGSLDTTR